jgi:hypothetical protein
VIGFCAKSSCEAKGGNIIKFQRVENGNHGLNGNLRDKCNKIWEFFKQIS